ncbi:RNA-binding motif protein, X-linked 2-like [Psammomys obesus]|uniref:RNA-binding motif protein, X-linked 2-like n=1 Tax=Psammomys obesus TaxID=48139 RepID=UPI0024536730|nr:RNA-binding motif protein, X-linked 2-like [Psammomys obesus]
MNPLTKVKLINELNEREVQLGVAEKVSWHSEYKDSAWIFLGGLPYELTEGDIICVFSQYGEIVNINLVRNTKTGKSKGFCFLCYEDQRSTVLAVDNFNGIKVNVLTVQDLPGVFLSLYPDKKEKKKEKEKIECKVQAELPCCSLSSRSKTVKEKDDHGPEKHNSKSSERVQKSNDREVKKNHSDFFDVRISFQGRAENPEWEPKKEKPKHEHKSLSRREEEEEKSRDKDRKKSSGTHSTKHNGHSEIWNHRSRSRILDNSHCHIKHRHSWDWESFHASDGRHY